MDCEEAWREAMREEEEGKTNQYPQQRLHDVTNVSEGKDRAMFTEKGNDAYDEFCEEELLHSLPFANDPAPAAHVAATATGPVIFPATAAPMQAGPLQTRTLLTTASTRTRAFPPPAVAVPNRRIKEAVPSRGVLDFPPTKTPSFMLRGDDGRVRWVTAAATVNVASTVTANRTHRHHNASRKRAREAAATAATAIEVSDDDRVVIENSNGKRMEVIRVSSSSASSSVSSFNNDGGDDGADSGIDAEAEFLNENVENSVSSEADAPPPHPPVHFLRDGVNVADMLREIYAEEAARQAEMKRKEDRVTRRLHEEESELHGFPDESAPNDPFLTPQRSTTQPRTSLRKTPSYSGSGELWVSKYSPKLFREVLSDESINLRLLQWLKSWDAYVFPEASPANGGAAGSSKLSGGALQQQSSSPKDGLTAFTSTTTSATAAAAATPPEERIAVLTGPPGVGKTTLVHVLAAHCGYEVIEINASVERTTSRLETLIKTAVSAAGPAPGGRVRPPQASKTQAGAAATTIHSGEKDTTDSAVSTSLVQHLLRPKCLLIDEMDGIASSSVATYLVQQQLHRPVFCLCNDFYVPSLRPLRQHCSHVYYLPPIRSQRLLARLEEIACQENAASLDRMALLELIAMSGGDVRSCLNTMQFINSVVHQQQHQGGGASGDAAVPPRHTIAELIRQLQGKDTRLALKESWQLLFTRPERNRAVQLLKQECGMDYEKLVEAAAAQHHRQHIVETRRRQEREQAIGKSPHTSAAAQQDPYAVEVGKRDGIQEGKPYGRSQQQDVAAGFRVDPGYLYAAQQLARCPDTAALVDGLQENYLDRAYTDFSFSRTCATAVSFSQKDIIVAASFQHPEMMMGTADRLNQVSALTCYVHCSTAARGGRIEFPREQATLRRLQSESQHIWQQFRSGCRPHITAFLGGEEVTSTDMAPMLLRCLFDRSLRLPAHAITSFSRLPPGDQRLLHASVARHVEYGLTYDRERQQHTPWFRGGTNRFGSFLMGGSGEEEAPWRLTPELDKLLAGIVRPMEKTLSSGHNGDGGGGRGAFLFPRSRYSNSSSTHAGTPNLLNRAKGSGGAATTCARLSLSSVLMPLKNEVLQILVGEIRQYKILQSVELLRQQTQQAQQQQHEKRPREDGNSSDNNRTFDAAGTPKATIDSSVKAIQDAANTLKAKEDGVRDFKKAKQEDAEGAKPATCTAVRRDFFGRPILESSSPPSTTASSNRAGRTPNTLTTSSSASPPPTTKGNISGGFSLSQPHRVPSTQVCVRYIYQDGSTNAVKMPAVLADF